MIVQRAASRRGRQKVMVLGLVLILVIPPGVLADGMPLLPAQRTGIDATADQKVDCILPSAVTLTGAITSEANAPIIGGTITARSAEGAAFEGPIQFSPLTQSSRYRVVLPPGEYRLGIKAIFLLEDTGSTLAVTFPEGDSIAVDDDVVHDLLVPPPPPLVRVRGVVRGLGDLDAETAALLFAAPEGTLQASTVLAEDYTVAMPVGRYVVGVLGLKPHLPDDQSELLNLELDMVTISGDTTVDLTIPPLVTVTGTIKAPEGHPPLQAQIAVANTDQQATRAAVIVTDQTDGQYVLRLPAGSYDAIAFVSLALGDEAQGVLGFPLLSRRFQAEAGAELHFTVPPVSSVVTISGRVTDDQGNPVEGAVLIASSIALTEAPGAFFTAAALSESDGTYQVVVLSGRDYTLVCTPPAL